VVYVEGLIGWIYIEDAFNTWRYRLVFGHLAVTARDVTEDERSRSMCRRSEANGACVELARPRRGEAMRWLERLVIELAQMCRDALGSWQRTGQLCVLILTFALGLALVLWVTHR
jgi:hypothetical protein